MANSVLAILISPIFGFSIFGSGFCDGGALEGGGARRVGGPKFRAFCALSHRKFILSSLSVGLLVEFWWCLFEAPGP